MIHDNLRWEATVIISPDLYVHTSFNIVQRKSEKFPTLHIIMGAGD